MDFAPSPRAADLAERVRAFVDTEVAPVEADLLADVAARRSRGEDPWPPTPAVETLKEQGPRPGPLEPLPPGRRGRCRTPRGSAPTAAPG